MIFYIFVSFHIFLILFKIYQKLTCGMCKCRTILTNKVVIVTGANTGIGFETAKDLAGRGAKVILACRDGKKCAQAKNKIIQETGNNKVVLKHLDLTSFNSVRAFCRDILENEKRLDILINNAGIGNQDNILTRDNITIESQVNYFSPYLLTRLLLPLLEGSAPSRIINVSSGMHWFGVIDFKTFHKPGQTDFSRRRTYSNTKLANILFTNKLHRKLEGKGVTVNALHPGLVSTDIFRQKSTMTKLFIKIMFKNAWEGAQTTIHLAVAPELEKVSGKYYADCKEAKTSSWAKNTELADVLWIFTKHIVFPKKEKPIYC